TQTRGSRKALRLTVDWDLFERDHDLFLIPSRIDEVRKECEEGTILRIANLREAWTDPQIARVYRYISDLLQPFPLSRRKPARAASGAEPDPGFKATFFRLEDGRETEIASEERMVFDYALAEVNGEVDAGGHASWRLISKRYQTDKRGTLSSSDKEGNVPF